MDKDEEIHTRRRFLAGAAASLAVSSMISRADSKPDEHAGKALIAITMDLEMARNFPNWEDTHWDYEKGNLNDDAKKYSVAVARRVKERGGRIHFFAVGQVFEQENVDWLKEIVAEGHPVGNHTYDHVYVLAQKPEEIQYRFARAPWLIEGKSPAQVIRENILLTTAAMKNRLGIAPAGFRTPGGFLDGLNGRPDIQQMMLDVGFKWVSCKYPKHPYGEVGKEPDEATFDGIVAAQRDSQPFIYPNGLIDVPMSPISDIGAFRNGRWPLDSFLKAIELSVRRVIERHEIFDFLCHPSVIGVMDPQFRTIDLISRLVEEAGKNAALVDLETMSRRARSSNT